MTGKLRRIFLTAVLGIGAGVAGGCGPSKEKIVPPDGEKRPKVSELTAGEKAHVRSIFGSSIDVDIIRIHSGGCTSKTAAMTTPNGKEILVCKKKRLSSDYSREKDLFIYGAFIHEMTHIWQDQNIDRDNRSCRIYPYLLGSQSTFSGYCIEQQASIVEDYARQFLFSSWDWDWGEPRMFNAYPKNALLLQKLVEDQFPAARAARLAVQAPKF